MSRKKGVLITLEGTEGSGKSTQIRLLRRYLQKKRRRVFLTREPGGTKVSDALRGVLLNPRHRRMTPLCETLLYMASRAQLVEEVIRPQLRRGAVVLCDRWLDATLAYQGYGGGISLPWIKALGRVVTQGMRPTKTVFLDLPVAKGLARVRRSRALDRVEQKNRLFHRRVYRGYRRLLRADRRRFVHVKLNGNESALDIHRRIVEKLARVI